MSFDKNKYWLKCTQFSKSERYESLTDWFDADDVFKICQQFVDDGDEETNFVFTFIEQNAEDIQCGFAERIAQLAGLTVAEAFPDQNFTKESIVKRKAAPKARTMSKPKSIEEALASVCALDHDDATNYKEVLDSYYFEEDRRFSSCSCRACKKYFATEANAKRMDYQEENCIPLPKGNKQIVYACEKFESGSCDCKNMLCSSCYIAKLGARSNKRRRTAS